MPNHATPTYDEPEGEWIRLQSLRLMRKACTYFIPHQDAYLIEIPPDEGFRLWVINADEVIGQDELFALVWHHFRTLYARSLGRSVLD